MVTLVTAKPSHAFPAAVLTASQSLERVPEAENTSQPRGLSATDPGLPSKRQRARGGKSCRRPAPWRDSPGVCRQGRCPPCGPVRLSDVGHIGIHHNGAMVARQDKFVHFLGDVIAQELDANKTSQILLSMIAL